MGPYEPAESLARLIEQLENSGEFAHAGGQTILGAMMVSRGITLLSHTTNFNKDIKGWILQTKKHQEMGHVQNFFTDPTMNKGERSPLQERGIHIGGTKNLLCNTAPSRTASRGDRKFKYYRPGNAEAELLSGRIITSQCSPYQI